MVNDDEIEADYYIDRAQEAVYVPDPEGLDKATVLEDRQDLFDFNLECEPILQVLVGKTLEQAKIEVIEEHET